MAIRHPPQFQAPLSLYASSSTRLRALEIARALKRQREERERVSARRKAHLERLIYNNTEKQRNETHVRHAPH